MLMYTIYASKSNCFTHSLFSCFLFLIIESQSVRIEYCNSDLSNDLHVYTELYFYLKNDESYD